MLNQTQKLIDAIREQKSSTIQATFESIMAEKTMAAIANQREVVIDSTFNRSKQSN